MIWLDQHVAELRKYHSNLNMTNRMIAAKLSQHFGFHFSAGMIKHKLTRLGIRRTTSLKAGITANIVPDPTDCSVRLMDTKVGQCKWPVGEVVGARMMCCGKSCVISKPYCMEHTDAAREKNPRPLRF